VKIPLETDWIEIHLDEIVCSARGTAGKRFREQMVLVAAAISGRLCDGSMCLKSAKVFADVIESIHLGSLVIDDIQDASVVRRGKPALHTRFGTPLALNAGNWLYFEALERLTVASDVPESRRNEAIRLLIAAMREAHEGQAVDLGVDMFTVDRKAVGQTVELASSKKTGALMEAAFGLGFLCASEVSDTKYRAFRDFGREWGIALQMLDDLGSFLRSLNGELPPERSFEDFRNGSPSFVWTMADELLDDSAHRRFQYFASSARDPLSESFTSGRTEFEDLIKASELFPRGLRRTRERIETAISKLEAQCRVSGQLPVNQTSEIQQLTTLSRELEAAYGNFDRFNKNSNQDVAEIVR